MKQRDCNIRFGIVAAALLLTGLAAGPAAAGVSAMDYDGAVPCQSFQRWGTAADRGIAGDARHR